MAKMKYKMSSRATILLGRESVSRVDGAIIELVKNTYDADAGFCCLCFDVEHDQIYILDNGVGMTKGIIETCWMLIGTDNKRVEYLSTKKRIKSGEKGIGRFALDRLGSKCKMYTKHDSEDLICWETDWSNFEKSGQIIDDVEADFSYCVGQQFEDIIPAEIKSALAKFAEEAEDGQFALSRGTLFIISGLRDKWTAREKEKVIDVLGYLIPPVEQQNYAIITQDSLSAVAHKVDNEITDDFDYKVPDNMKDLLKLPGVGRKSANLIIGDVFGGPAIVTDTHCIRLVNRFGLVNNIKDPKKVEMELWKLIPGEEGSDFCHRLVIHGRDVCTARTTPYCDRCCLNDICKKRGV